MRPVCDNGTLAARADSFAPGGFLARTLPRVISFVARLVPPDRTVGYDAAAVDRQRRFGAARNLFRRGRAIVGHGAYFRDGNRRGREGAEAIFVGDSLSAPLDDDAKHPVAFCIDCKSDLADRRDCVE